MHESINNMTGHVCQGECSTRQSAGRKFLRVAYAHASSESGDTHNLLSCPSTFWLCTYISRFGEGFREGQYGLVTFLLFFYSRCPRAQPFVKVGARAPVSYGVSATVATLSTHTVTTFKWYVR